MAVQSLLDIRHRFFFLFPFLHFFFSHPRNFVNDIKGLNIEFNQKIVSKAFDCVCHTKLLHKLRHQFGIQGPQFILMADGLSIRLNSILSSE